jgi:hypothetical protein
MTFSKRFVDLLVDLKILNLKKEKILNKTLEKGKMWSDTILIVFISVCTAFLGEGTFKTFN